MNQHFSHFNRLFFGFCLNSIYSHGTGKRNKINCGLQREAVRLLMW